MIKTKEDEIWIRAVGSQWGEEKEKELVEEFKEDVNFYKKEGLEDFLNAVDFDLE